MKGFDYRGFVWGLNIIALILTALWQLTWGQL